MTNKFYDEGWNARVQGKPYVLGEQAWRDGWLDCDKAPPEQRVLMQSPPDLKAERIKHLENELGRAYRALHGFYHCHVTGKQPDKAMLGYHSPTLGAARRFITDESLDGASYFEGKKIEVLHEVLKQYQPS